LAPGSLSKHWPNLKTFHECLPYLYFTREKTLDEQELPTYSKVAPATLAGHEVKVLKFYGPHEDLEGATTEGTVILEFPQSGAIRRR